MQACSSGSWISNPSGISRPQGEVRRSAVKSRLASGSAVLTRSSASQPCFVAGRFKSSVLRVGEKARMVTLSDGNYSHVPIDTLLHGKKSVDVSALYDPGSYRARLMRVEVMPMFLY